MTPKVTTIEDIQQAKNELTVQILPIIRDFIEKTGLVPDIGVEVTEMHTNCGIQRTIKTEARIVL